MAIPCGKSIYGSGKPKKSRKKQRKLLILIAVLLLIALACELLLYKLSSRPVAVDVTSSQQAPTGPKPEPAAEPQLPNLQPVVDNWISSHSGIYSIKITDTKGNTLAQSNADKQFDPASLYKLFVAYVGYQKIDDGSYQYDQLYLNNKSFGQCLDAMIRDSDSPCGEKMMTDLGKVNVTSQMHELGLTNTSLPGFYTTASDVSIILRRIAMGEGLSKASQDKYLDSMKTQDAKYRRGLPSGFTSEFTVFNKVGWRLDRDWHDAAIIELPDGQRVTVTVLTTGVGYQNIAGLGQQIEAALK